MNAARRKQPTPLRNRPEPSSPTVKSSSQLENNVSKSQNSPETEMISPEDDNQTEHSDNNHNICKKTKANNSFVNKTPAKLRKISKDEPPSVDNKNNEKPTKTKKKQFASGLAIPALVRIHVVRNNSTKNTSDKKPRHVPEESDAIETKDFVTSAISIDSSVTSAKDIDISTADSENTEQQPRQHRNRLQAVDIAATSTDATHIQDETVPPLSNNDNKSVIEEDDVPIGNVNARSRRSPSLPLGPGGPFTCSQCGGAYPSRELLDKHELLHSPNTQSCKICNKSFANVYRLQRHMISHDESALLRKFKCNDCDKAFKFKHHLKEHLRIHSGEKPFECGNCGKKFSHSGSYSSHMTSKKCLVMNLKMGRIRPNNPALNPERSPSRKRNSNTLPQINNNSSSNNNNSFLPMLPKYSDAAAAAFLASITPRDGGFPTSQSPLAASALHSLYLPPSMPLSHPSTMTPFSFPATLSHLFEHFTSPQYLPRKLETEYTKALSPQSDPEDMIEEVTEEEDKRSSVGDEQELVMDIEEEEAIKIKQEKQSDDYPQMNNKTIFPNRMSPAHDSGPGLGLNMILESVLSNQTSVTKKLLQAQTSKQTPNENIVPDITIKSEPDEPLKCLQCHKVFNHKTELVQHEQVLCGKLFRKHEGLAAQVAETLALNRMEAELHASIHSGMSGSEDDEYSKEDGKTTHENERKVRVRTAISDEQQAILKDHYARNQKPNREEFKKIAQRLGLDNRVVQVWFQNNRARVRRMNQTISYSEQPLDLSTKKTTQSTTSSPSISPHCNMSAVQSDSGEEAVNLSQKSSRSPTPYRNPFQPHYQHSNCSSSSLTDFRHSPSPHDILLNGTKKNAFVTKSSPLNNSQISDKLPAYDAEDAPHSPVMSSVDILRASSSSPSSEKRSWTEESRISQNETDVDKTLKKNRLKNVTTKEPEGQFICDQCDKAFVKQSSLARHKYEHSGQRPYKCIECPRAFKHKHHLAEHKRLHTGEKPFQCCKCLKKFSHSGSYSQHMNHRYSYCKPYRE